VNDISNIEWPYATRYGVQNEVDADILVLGGGMAGPLAAITAAKKGLKVVLVDKGCTSYSGAGGSGFDHWTNSPGPESPVSPKDLVNARHETSGGYKSRIADFISISESYDVLLEMESYGAKVRDTDNVFAGSDFRDENTKLLYASDYVNKYTMRMWGRTFKPALYKELKRCGIKLYERVMTTALLNEGGAQGGRVVGATGVNVRTGEFYVFRARATILCLGHPGSQGWIYSAEHQGMGGRHGPGLASGDGQAMAWKAGAELAMMENSVPVRRHHAPTEGSYFASWHPCTLVDAEGREIPWVDRDGTIISRVSDRAKPAPGQKLVLPTGPHAMKSTSTGEDLYYKYMRPSLTPDLNERLAKGEFKKPLYCDFPGMPPDERRVIYGLMIGHEGTTWLAYHNMTRAGFNPDKHLLQLYDEPAEGGGYGWRRLDRGGVGHEDKPGWPVRSGRAGFRRWRRIARAQHRQICGQKGLRIRGQGCRACNLTKPGGGGKSARLRATEARGRHGVEGAGLRCGQGDAALLRRYQERRALANRAEVDG